MVHNYQITDTTHSGSFIIITIMIHQHLYQFSSSSLSSGVLVKWVLEPVRINAVFLRKFTVLKSLRLVIRIFTITHHHHHHVNSCAMIVLCFSIIIKCNIDHQVRLARAVRLLPSFKEMWLLLRGLTDSLRTLLWTLVIIIGVLYIFAIAATEIVGQNDDDDKYLEFLNL